MYSTYEINIEQYQDMFESRISVGATEKLPGWETLHAKTVVGRTIWKDMLKKKKTLRDIASWRKKRQLHKVSSSCLDDHRFKKKELESAGELSKVCSQIVLKCVYLARIGRPDILWSVNKLARTVTKWTGACNKRLACLISYIHHTSDCRQCCHVGNTGQHCRLGLFQDADFAGDLGDSKSTW